MKTALANWKTLWDEIRSKMSSSAVGEMGFETSADSYWTLVRLIVQRFETKSAASTTGTSNGTESPVAIPASNGANGGQEAIIDSPLTGPSARGASPDLDFMPLEADCDSQGAHLRRILKK